MVINLSSSDENTLARDPKPQTVCDEVLEKSKCRHAIITQTCGRDDSFETTEALKTEESFLTFIMRMRSEEKGQWSSWPSLTFIPHISHVSLV